MKISILCPWEIPVPLNGSYGGIERIADDLAVEAHRQGHETQIFCVPSAGAPDYYRTYPPLTLSAGEGSLVIDLTHEKLGSKFVNMTKKNYISYPFLTDRLSGINDVFPTRTVADEFGQPHAKVVFPGIADHYKQFGGLRVPVPDGGVATVPKGQSYLLFLGRISKHKRPDIAIQVGRMTGYQVLVAGHIGKWSTDPDPSYSSVIEAQADGKSVLVMPNPTEEAKVELLRDAAALLVPSQWSMIGSKESFGIVAVEALMAGIPVITSGEGGLSEIVTPETGFVCSSLDEYVSAVMRIGAIKPQACIDRGRYFRSDRMLADLIAYWRECQ